MRFMEWTQSTGKIIHGSICLWLVMNKSSVFSAQRSTSFQILYCVLARYTGTPNQTLHGNKDLGWFKTSQEYRNLDSIDGEPMEFEWNNFQWSFLGPGSEKKWYSVSADGPQGKWDRIEEKMLEFGESKHTVFRATSPLSRGQLKSKKRWKTVDTLLCRFGYF